MQPVKTISLVPEDVNMVNGFGRLELSTKACGKPMTDKLGCHIICTADRVMTDELVAVIPEVVAGMEQGCF